MSSDLRFLLDVAMVECCCFLFERLVLDFPTLLSHARSVPGKITALLRNRGRSRNSTAISPEILPALAPAKPVAGQQHYDAPTVFVPSAAYAEYVRVVAASDRNHPDPHYRRQ